MYNIYMDVFSLHVCLFRVILALPSKGLPTTTPPASDVYVSSYTIATLVIAVSRNFLVFTTGY